MTGKSSREQPLEELIETFKVLQEKAKTQDCMIQKFQKLIQDEGLSSKTIKDFFYPMAVFRQDGVLILVNNALSEETGLYIEDLSKGKHSIINRITDSNFQILDAVENAFMGESTFLNGLSDPLDMFISESSSKKVSASSYRSAIFFPVIEDAGQITHGIAVFIK